jgi:hypothetical protein
VCYVFVQKLVERGKPQPVPAAKGSSSGDGAGHPTGAPRPDGLAKPHGEGKAHP